MSFSIVDVLFGVPFDKLTNFLFCVNYVILQGKHFIYKSKQKNESIFLLYFLQKLKQELNSERDRIVYCEKQL